MCNCSRCISLVLNIEEMSWKVNVYKKGTLWCDAGIGGWQVCMGCTRYGIVKYRYVSVLSEEGESESEEF